jgi:hypothetical protein
MVYMAIGDRDDESRTVGVGEVLAPLQERVLELKNKYGDRVDEAGKSFWGGLTEVANRVEGKFGLLAVASAIPIIPGVYSVADVMVAVNGIDEWRRGQEDGDPNLKTRGIVKAAVSLIPGLPVSWAAPLIDKALPVNNQGGLDGSSTK